MKPQIQWPTVRTAAIAAAALAFISFFFISNYRPGLSVIGNIMTGEIRYQQRCPLFESTPPNDLLPALPPGAVAVPPPPPGFTVDKPPPCGGSVPYRWILALLAAFMGAVAIKRWRQ